MESKNQPMRERGGENDILFSRTVKAGKRVYYIDVKCDRRGEYYLSLTESKRLKDQGDVQHPVFEKHKIFLYREDLERFQQAFEEAADYTRENAPEVEGRTVWGEMADANDAPGEEPLKDEFKLDIEF